MDRYMTVCMLILFSIFWSCGKSKNPISDSQDIQYETFQSSCKGGSDIAISKIAYSGPVTISSHRDTIYITQHDVRFNCCSRIEVNIVRTFNGFDIKEKDVGQPCRCNCLFDVQTLICGLADGSYYVRLFDPYGNCVGSSAVDIPPKFSVFGSFQSKCKNRPHLMRIGDPQVDSLADTITFSSYGDTVEITHRNADYNCCSKLGTRVQTTVEGFDIYEVDTAKDWCFCGCHFDLTSFIYGISPGDYLVRIFDTDGNLVGEIEFKFPPV